MRRTGKLYTLTLVSALLSVVANILIMFWNDNTPQWHLWLDIVPQGFGMASVITSTLIVSLTLSLARSLSTSISCSCVYLGNTGYDSGSHQRRPGGRHWDHVSI